MSMDAAPAAAHVNCEFGNNDAPRAVRATNGGVRFVKHKGFVRPCEEFLQRPARRGMQSIRSMSRCDRGQKKVGT